MRLKISDETITRALLALRKKTVQEGRPGLKHVEALLKIQGEPLPPIPRKVDVHFKRGQLRLAILRALRDGPLTSAQVTAIICQQEGIERTQLRYEGVAKTMSRMGDRGELGHESPVWWLAP